MHSTSWLENTTTARERGTSDEAQVTFDQYAIYKASELITEPTNFIFKGVQNSKIALTRRWTSKLDRWIAFDPLYTLSLTSFSFLSLYK